jgi:hypothetical protein
MQIISVLHTSMILHCSALYCIMMQPPLMNTDICVLVICSLLIKFQTNAAREPVKCKSKRTIRGKLVGVMKRKVDDSVGALTPLKFHLKSKGFMVVQED